MPKMVPSKKLFINVKINLRNFLQIYCFCFFFICFIIIQYPFFASMTSDQIFAFENSDIINYILAQFLKFTLRFQSQSYQSKASLPVFCLPEKLRCFSLVLFCMHANIFLVVFESDHRFCKAKYPIAKYWCNIRILQCVFPQA